MLRLAVLLLVLANAAYYAWSQGLLAPWGFEPARQTESQRLQQQIKPETVRVVPGDEARRGDGATVAGAKTGECLQAGPLDEAQLVALRPALEALPAGSWAVEPGIESARWIIYMGKYLTAENVSRKRAELRQLGVSFEPVGNPALEPGLSLGGFATQATATQQLTALAARGVHTAKVVQERPELRGQLVKWAAVDDNLRARLEEIKPALAGKSLRPCA